MKTLLLFLALMITINISSQTVHIVDNNQGAAAAYSNIQDAVDAASPGDIIYIQPSPNNYGDIQMTKPLNIYGMGYNPQLNGGVNAQVNNVLFRYADASGSKISGLYINSVYLDNTTYSNHDVVITNNRLTSVEGNSSTSRANNAIISGNFFYHGSSRAIYNYNSQNWVISNNTFSRPNSYWDYELIYKMNSSTIFNNNIILSRQVGNGSQSVELFRECIGTQISNNIFIFTGTNVTNFNIGSNSGLNFQNNLTYSYNTTIDALSGMNNLDNTDPQFTSFNPNAALNSTGNDYHILAGSLAENAGTDGNDLGVFNGNFPYDNRGYPTELPYLTDFVIYNNILSAGTPLYINIKADANINN